MARALYLDSFTSLDEMPKRARGSEQRVMFYLRRAASPDGTVRVSTFEMDGVLHDTLCALQGRKLIRELPAAYPWHRYELDADRIASWETVLPDALKLNLPRRPRYDS